MPVKTSNEHVQAYKGLLFTHLTLLPLPLLHRGQPHQHTQGAGEHCAAQVAAHQLACTRQISGQQQDCLQHMMPMLAATDLLIT